MIKTIIVQWVESDSDSEREMRVVVSTHDRFIVGSRFDYGFFNIATNEGYTIISLPMENKK